MKATGIIRKIDELGRIVIPKEIRRTMRIREMDSIEIYTGSDGEIILKKYSPMGELALFARDYADSLARISGNCVCITDKEQIIAASGSGKKVLENAPVSRELVSAMIERKNITASQTDRNFVRVIDKGLSEYTQEIISPIISEGDILGMVIMLAKDTSPRLTPVDEKIISVIRLDSFCFSKNDYITHLYLF